MDPEKLKGGAQPEVLARYVASIPQMEHHPTGGVVETVREADHAGRHIVIRTTYRIEVDGRPFEGSLTLDNEGRLYCHSLPNYQFGSAVEMMKRMIEAYPEEFPQGGDPGSGPSGQGPGHGGHGPSHGGEHGHDHRSGGGAEGGG